MQKYTRTKCEGCGDEIIHEKDSTGEYLDQDEANSFEYPNLCSTCANERQEPKSEDRREESEAGDQKGINE